MKSKEAQDRKTGIAYVGWEYENLYQALQTNLEQQESPYTIWWCLYTYLDLTNNRPSQLQLTKNIYDTLYTYTPEQRTQQWEQDISPISGNLATCYGRNQDYQKAKEIYQQTLTLILQFQGLEESLQQSYLADTYHNLGRVAQELREWTQARDYYQQALEICIEYNDRFNQAVTLHGLGMVAQELREWTQARDYYQQALEIKIEYGARYEQARTYHNLGRVAFELREWTQAGEYYQQALAIWIEYNDRYEQARIYHQLGMVAQELRDLESAQTNLLQALTIFAEFNDQHSLGIAWRNLARLYQKNQDESLITDAAAIVNITAAELKEAFDNFNSENS